MSLALPGPLSTHVLLFTFEHSHLEVDIAAMKAVMENSFNWKVTEHKLPIHGPNAANSMQTALRDFRSTLKNINDKIIVFYGGHAIMKDQDSAHTWEWLSAPIHGKPVCMEHANKIQPVPYLKDFASSMAADILFIFHSAWGPHTPVSDIVRPPRSASVGNVQVVAVHERAAFAAPIMNCSVHGCQRRSIIYCPPQGMYDKSATRTLIDAMSRQFQTSDKVTVGKLLETDFDDFHFPIHKALNGDKDAFELKKSS